MDKKITITLTVLMVATLVAPAVMAANTNTYTVTVQGAQSTTVAAGPSGVAFGSLAKGATSTLTSSLNLTNSGDANASVNARFTTNVSTTYGLVSGSNVLPATNFSLGITGNLVPLNNTGSDAPLGTANNIPMASSVLYNAALSVPVAQTGGTYSGTVQLTFANA